MLNVNAHTAQYLSLCRQFGGTCKGEFQPRTLAVSRVAQPGMEILADATVLTGEWQVAVDDRLVCDHFVQTPMPGLSAYLTGSSADRLNFIQDRAQDSDVASAFLLGGCRNYAHWLIDFLPKMMFYGQAPHGTPIVVNRDLAAHQRETLAMLGADESALLPVAYPGAVRFARLLSPSLCSNLTGTPFPLRQEAIAWLRTTFRPEASGEPQARVFVSRRRQPERNRRLSNADEIFAEFKAWGFVEVFPEEMPFAEQVKLFAQAEVIAGPHGAGLANGVFAPATCIVIDLLGPLVNDWYRPNMLFSAVSALLGQRYHRVVGKGLWREVPYGEFITNEAYRVDPKAVRTALRHLLARRSVPRVKA